MLARSATYLSLFADANHSVEWRVSVNGTTYEKEKLAASTGGGDSLPRLTRNLFSGSTPTIGGCCAATFDCTIFEASSNVPRMATVIPSYRLVKGSTTSEWITLGTFFIDTRSVNKSTGALSLCCYDAVLKLDGVGGASYADVTSIDEWPQSMSDVVDDIAGIIGVEVDSRTVIQSGDGYMVDFPNDLTMREVMGYIAAAHCGNWCLTPDNKFRLIPLTGGADSVSLGTATADLKASDPLAAYTGVTVYWADEDAYSAGDETGTQIVADCPWATQGTADGMLTAIGGYSYQPYTASGAYIDLAVELGDEITVGFPGDTVTGPCFSIDITCDVIEAADVSAPGEAEVDHEYPYTDYVERNMKRRVGLGQPYFGVTISRQKGIEIIGYDELGAEMNRALLNAEHFSMDAMRDFGWEQQFYFDPERRSYIFNGALGADALYADYGDIAELTVDELSTSRRIKKYILGDTTDDNYIHIKGQFIRWITGSVIPGSGLMTETDENTLTEQDNPIVVESISSYATTQAVNRYGQGLYWQAEPVGHTSQGYPTDSNGDRIYATVDETEWPVIVYQYRELIKAEFAFDQTGRNYIPQIILGAGDENGNSRGYLYKDESALRFKYVTSLGKDVNITYGDDGFVDADHRRLESCHIDRQNGRITYTVEGDEDLHQLGFTESSGRVEFTWPDGFRCEVEVT